MRAMRVNLSLATHCSWAMQTQHSFLPMPHRVLAPRSRLGRWPLRLGPKPGLWVLKGPDSERARKLELHSN
jgi:hypothetical protein